MAEAKKLRYEYQISEERVVYFYVNEKGIVVDRTESPDGGFTLLENGKIVEVFDKGTKGADKLTKELTDSIVEKLNFRGKGTETERIYDEIYQIFGVNVEHIFPILALNFLVEEIKDKIRFFGELPSKDQLNSIAHDCSPYQECVVFPLAFKDHFATGICKNGVFYIFDSTRQVAKDRTTEINGQIFYSLNRNKKFQSELTGTCGFWTMYFCLEFADSKEQDFSDVVSLEGKSPKIQEEALVRIGNKVYSVTGSILCRNKSEILKIDSKFNFENLLVDVKETAEGIQPSRRFSKSMSTFEKTDSKRGKKKFGCIADTQVSNEQIPEETSSVPSQLLIPSQLQGDTIQLSKDVRNEIEALKSEKQVIKRQRSDTI